ncbi:MAG: hypothetical protein HZA24_10025 [Nitrospirae bacterium]|nr:hypothetical protein [Nitrospirota bacterium]
MDALTLRPSTRAAGVALAAGLLLAATLAPCAAAQVGPSGGAPAQGARQTLTASGGPVTIHADAMAFSGKARTVTFTGAVRVEQDGMTLAAQRIEVTLEDDGPAGAQGIRHMVATGDVHFAQGERQATAGSAEYDPAAQTVTLADGPRVTDGGMAVAGERITIHLVSGESTVEGGVFTFQETR